MSNDLTFTLRWQACHMSGNHTHCRDAGRITFPQAPTALRARRIFDGLAFTIPMVASLDEDPKPFQVSQIRATVLFQGIDLGVAFDFKVHDSRRSNDGSLELRLPTHAIRHIERVRAGGNVTFELHLHCELSRLVPQKEGPFVLQTELQPNDFKGTVTYPKELWVNLLNETGFGENVVVEIPLPPNPGPSWQPIWKALATARDGLKYGGDTAWKAAIVECRHALELWQKLEREDHGPGWSSPSSTDRAARTRQQRLDNLRWDLLQCAHEAAHTPADKWTRDDAVLILATLSSLLAIRNP